MLAVCRCQLASALFAACRNPDCGHKQSSVRLYSNVSGSGDAQNATPILRHLVLHALQLSLDELFGQALVVGPQLLDLSHDVARLL
jgi:hypothetical protein